MRLSLKALPILSILCFLALAVSTAAQGQPQATTQNARAVETAHANFASPEAAVTGLATAMRSDDRKLLIEVLGRDAEQTMRSSDATVHNDARTKFLAAYDEHARIERKGEALAILHVGKDDWPLPFPLVKHNDRWEFDTTAGVQEWRDRRIGADELSAIQISLAYVDAQREYVLKNRPPDGLREYARHIVSSEGLHDGLYWPRKGGEPQSPMGLAFAEAGKQPHGVDGMGSKPYHGYFFRILTAQGKSARGGALDYMVKGKLIGGFALIGYPATYGETGLKTFIVNHDGIVYSKDLGPQTESAAEAITLFDPDSSWQREANH